MTKTKKVTEYDLYLYHCFCTKMRTSKVESGDKNCDVDDLLQCGVEVVQVLLSEGQSSTNPLNTDCSVVSFIPLSLPAWFFHCSLPLPPSPLSPFLSYFSLSSSAALFTFRSWRRCYRQEMEEEKAGVSGTKRSDTGCQVWRTIDPLWATGPLACSSSSAYRLHTDTVSCRSCQPPSQAPDNSVGVGRILGVVGYFPYCKKTGHVKLGEWVKGL